MVPNQTQYKSSYPRDKQDSIVVHARQFKWMQCSKEWEKAKPATGGSYLDR